MIFYHYNQRYQHYSGSIYIYSDGRDLCPNFKIKREITDRYYDTSGNRERPPGDWKVVAKSRDGKEIDSDFIAMMPGGIEISCPGPSVPKSNSAPFVPHDFGLFSLQADQVESLELYYKESIKCKMLASDIKGK